MLYATGVRNGPAHVEVMVTPDGPRLIEIGAGESRITRMVRHRVDGAVDVWRYTRHQHVKPVYLSSPAAGELRNAARLDSLPELLPSFQRAVLPYREGSQVPRTEALWTSLGYVVLATTDISVLERDEALVREIEAGLVVV